jgi:cytochrome c biogenesis protein CcdA/thiol-disulfide isomerase/thioredoxin
MNKNTKLITKILISFVVLILSMSLVLGFDLSPDSSTSCTNNNPELCDIETSNSTTNQNNLIQEDLLSKIYNEHDEGKICIIFFMSKTCPHCHNIEPVIDNLAVKYDEQVSLTKIYVDDYEGFNLYNTYCDKNDYAGKKIPLVAIGDKYYIGETEIKNNLENKIQELMISPQDRICPLAGIGSCSPQENNEDHQDLVGGFSKNGELIWYKTIPAILISGLFDGINPCAFAVLIFMMTILLEISGSKKRVLKIALAYIFAFAVTNITLGMLVYWFSDLVFKGSQLPLLFAASIAILAGIINVKDYFFYGKGISLQIPKKTKKIVQKWMNYASVPASIILGIILAIFEAPCSASVYYAILEMLRNKTATLFQAFPYIILYNFVFILPLIVLFTLIYMGKNVNIMEKWREEHKKLMKLIIGLILIILGLSMFLGWI